MFTIPTFYGVKILICSCQFNKIVKFLNVLFSLIRPPPLFTDLFLVCAHAVREAAVSFPTVMAVVVTCP